MKMQILKSQFTLLAYSGCWRPNSCETFCRNLMYTAFAIFMLFMINSFTLTELLAIGSHLDDMDVFSEVVCSTSWTFQACCKMFCILAKRDDILELIDLFTREPCKSMDNEETKIEVKCDKLTRSIMLLYLISVELSTVCDILNALNFEDMSSKNLPYVAWLPFDYSSTIIYQILYLYQLTSMSIVALVHVSVDSLFIGLLLHLCNQMEILKHRMKVIAERNNDILKLSAWHHDVLYQMAAKINDIFKTIIFSQFSTSMLSVCCSMLQMTSSPMFSTPFMQFLVYIWCLFLQIFFYCWYGNEVTLKSHELNDYIFATDWMSLGTSDRRTLLMIMKRTMMPIEISSANFINVTLDSFMNLLKTSYSAYNLLQQTKDRKSTS